MSNRILQPFGPPRSEIDRISRITEGNCLALLHEVILPNLTTPAPPMSGKGVVIPAGGRYLRYAYATVTLLRELDPDIPVEIWHIGEQEIDGHVEKFAHLNVAFRDGLPLSKEEHMRGFNGWSLKSLALRHTTFRDVLFLDADSCPLKPPAAFFASPEYRDSGLVLWPDVQVNRASDMIFTCLGLKAYLVPEHEAGQILLDRQRHWKTVLLNLVFNSHPEFSHKIIFGDKDWPGLCAAVLKEPFLTAPAAQAYDWGIIHHWFDGSNAFHHVMHNKRNPSVNTPERYARLWAEYDALNTELQPV